MAALTLSVACLGGSCENKPPFDLKLTTILSDYPSGTRPIFGLSLGLLKDAPQGWTVNHKAMGTISVLSMTRDGVRVVPSINITTFSEDPHLLQLQGFEWLTPGAYAPIQLTLTPDDGGRGWELTTFDLDPPHYVYNNDNRLTVPLPSNDNRLTAPFYPRFPSLPWAKEYLMSPGSYSLQLQYKYQGPENDEPNVFRGTVNSNTIVFRLH